MTVATNTKPPDSASSVEVGEPASWHSRIRELFRVIDAKDIEGFLSYLTPDAVFRFGNAPVAKGHGAIRDALAPFYASIASLEHTVNGTWIWPGTAFCLMEVVYTRLDGRRVTLPVSNTMLIKGNLITDYLIYMDITPVYAP